MTERKSPPVYDSDLIYLAIKRLEAVAEKMQRLEYDDELNKMMERAAEWFEWAAYNMAQRNEAAPASPVSGVSDTPTES